MLTALAILDLDGGLRCLGNYRLFCNLNLFDDLLNWCRLRLRFSFMFNFTIGSLSSLGLLL